MQARSVRAAGPGLLDLAGRCGLPWRAALSRRPEDTPGRRIGGDLVPPAPEHSPAWSFPGAGAYQFNTPDPLRSHKEKCPGVSTDTWAMVHMAIAFFMGRRWLMKGFSAFPSVWLLLRLLVSTPFLTPGAASRPVPSDGIRRPGAACDSPCIRPSLWRVPGLHEASL